MDKQDVVHIHNDTLLSDKKDGLPFVTIRMDLEGITLSEIRQRKTNTMWSHMWNLKNQTNKTNENNQWLFKWKFKNMTYRLPWWLSGRVHLPVQETWVQSLVWEDPTCSGKTNAMHHNWAHVLQLLKPTHPWACVLQQETQRNEKPTHCNWGAAPSRTTKEKPM